MEEKTKPSFVPLRGTSAGRQENIGVGFVLISSMLWGLFPVLVNKGVDKIPPLTFAAYSLLLAAVVIFAYFVYQNKWSELKIKKAYFPVLMITICIIIIPYTLFFIGAKMTSGINTSMLLMAEIIFTLFVTHLIGERTTVYKLLGAGGVFFGSLIMLYNGTLSLNLGDLLIILSTMTYPVGNFYAKKALNMISPATILLIRDVLGGLFLLSLSLLFERDVEITKIFVASWPYLIINGLVLLAFTKIVFYEALKRLDISKAISIGMTYPIFSLLVLILFFDEKISSYQWIGIFIIMIGVYFSVRRRSVDPSKTLYSPG